MSGGNNLMSEAVVEEQPEEEKKTKYVSPDVHLSVNFCKYKYKYKYKYRYKYKYKWVNPEYVYERVSFCYLSPELSTFATTVSL